MALTGDALTLRLALPAPSAMLRLTRPRIQAAVALSVLPTLASEGWPSPARTGALLLGTLAVGVGCDAFNAAWEHESDARMARTRTRPVATGEITPEAAHAAAVLAFACGLALLGVAGGVLAVAIALAAILNYALVYTVWLKPRSPLAAIVGGASGCVGPLLADACDGRLGPAGVIPFLALVAWTPPHVWAIAAWRRTDDDRSGTATLPRVAGHAAARSWGLAWLALVIPLSLIPVLDAPSPAWPVAVGLLDAGLVAAFVRAKLRDCPSADRLAFIASVRWLAAWLLLLLAHGLGPTLAA